MPVLTLPLQSGLNLKGEKTADELVEAKNLSYDENGVLSMRRGMSLFGNPVPDTVVALNTCDAITNWVASDDAVNVTLDTTLEKRGTGCVNFDVTVATSGNDFATLTNASLGTIDIVDEKGHLGFWLYIPATATTDLTSLQIRLGSDSSNYYQWTVLAAVLTSNTYHFIRLDYADASTTGTPVDTSIDYFQIVINYAATYGDLTDFRIDDLRSYSLTSTAAITSYFEFERDDTGLAINLVKVVAICFSGANSFQFDEVSNSWSYLNGTVTEFETETGRETERTRWTFAVYKNIIHMCNGIDNFRTFDGILVVEYAGTPKYRVLLYFGDRIIGSGVDGAPITLDYTDAAAANAQTLPNQVVVGGDEEGGRINCLRKIMAGGSALALCYTNNQIFIVNLVSGSESSDPINTQNGGYSNRSVKEVGNGIFYLSDSGIETLKYKSGRAEGSGIESAPLTDGIQKLLRNISENQRNANAALYAKPLKNYYFQFDATNNNVPDTTIVYSSLKGLKGPWTTYDWQSAYDFGRYKNASGEVFILLASALGGQMWEVETGFDDDGVEISFSLDTGDIDPVNPKQRDLTQFKNIEWIDFAGDMNEGGIINGEIITDSDNTINRFQITDNNLDKNAVATPIGIKPIGLVPIGAEGSDDDIDLFPYSRRISLYGNMFKTIRVKLDGDPKTLHAKFRRIKMKADGEVFDLVSTQMFSS